MGSLGTNCNFAFTPGVYINQTDTGGEWRTLAEASLTADLVLDSAEARPGIGFASKDGRQWVYVVLNAAENSLEAWRKNSDGSATRIKQITGAAHTPTWSIQTGTKYRLEMDWSPYSDALIVFLHDQQGAVLADFRAVIDLPAARRPLLACSGGEARFDNVKIQPWMVGIQSGSGKKLRFLPRTSAIRVLRNWEPPCIFMELR